MEKYNINHDVIIYPSEEGWRKIEFLLSELYPLDKKQVKVWLKERRTKDEGYKDQLWNIISELSGLFFNGTPYFKTMEIILCEEKKEVKTLIVNSKLNWVYKLFKYKYTYHCQGTEEVAEDYALMYVPEDASFNNNRSTLMNKKHREYDYEIDIHSVEDLTIRF
jgi:hypothetical protein